MAIAHHLEEETNSLMSLGEGWHPVRLGDVVNIIVSNVDKKSMPNERSIRLCNYIDVYYNDEISSSLDFMGATASDTEIERFSLKKWDTLITKDSETSDDIAKPALVVENLPSVVCGLPLGYSEAQIDTRAIPRPATSSGRDSPRVQPDRNRRYAVRPWSQCHERPTPTCSQIRRTTEDCCHLGFS